MDGLLHWLNDWDHLWAIPAGWLLFCLLVVLALYARGRNR